MSSIDINPHRINQVFDNPVNQEVDEVIEDFTGIYPEEVVWEVFSHLNLPSLANTCLVNKEWKRLADKPSLWKTIFYRTVAFGNEKWAKYFGKDVVKDEDNREEFSSLPLNEFISDLQKFKKIFPEKKAKDILKIVRLPKTLSGGLTLKSLGLLSKKYFPNNEMGYKKIPSIIIHLIGDRLIDRSCWVIMLKFPLRGTRNKDYITQKTIVASLTRKGLIGYKIPELLKATTCILAHYFDSKECLFPRLKWIVFEDIPWTSIRCEESDKYGLHACVGNFTPEEGLEICMSNFTCKEFGVTVTREL